MVRRRIATLESVMMLALVSCATASRGPTPDEARMSLQDVTFSEVAQTTAEGRRSRPLFRGANSIAAGRLNQWVELQWANDQGCGPGGAGLYSRSLAVVHLTDRYAVFSDTGTASCASGRAPGAWRDQFIVDRRSGRTLDLWDALTDKNRVQLRTDLAMLGLTERAGEPCAASYELNVFPERLRFWCEEGTVHILPGFNASDRACDEEIKLSAQAFKTLVKADQQLESVVDDWCPPRPADVARNSSDVPLPNEPRIR